VYRSRQSAHFGSQELQGGELCMKKYQHKERKKRERKREKRKRENRKRRNI
jgi:hypothetical protein